MMLLDLLLVALVAAGFWAVPLLARSTLPFGVRVPAQRAADPAVIAARRSYTRVVWVLGALAAVAVLLPPAVGWAIPAATVATVQVAACFLAYLHAWRTVAVAKRRGQWYAGLRQGVTADTTLRTNPERTPWPWLLPAAIVTLATAALGAWRYPDLPAALPTIDGLSVNPAVRAPTTLWTAASPVLTQAGIVALTALLTPALLRTRADLDAAQPATSAYRYRRYLGGIARLVFAMAAAMSLSMLGVAAQLWGLVEASMLWRVVALIPLVVAMAGFLWFGVRVGEAGHRLAAAEDEDSRLVQRDDDRYWYLGGLVYVNRGDPALMVPRRVGMGAIMNLGHPVAWVALSLLALVLLLQAFGVISLPTR